MAKKKVTLPKIVFDVTLMPDNDPMIISINTGMQLSSIGLKEIYDVNGDTIYVLEDYPNRPVADKGLPYLTQPVGYVQHHLNTSPPQPTSYTLNARGLIKEPSQRVKDLRPALKELIKYSEDFLTEHGVAYPLNLTTPMLLLFPHEQQKALECLAAEIHPKRAGDLLALGYSYAQVHEYKDVPADWLFKTAPNAVK